MVKLIKQKNLEEKNVILLKYYKDNTSIVYFPPYENIIICDENYDLKKISEGFQKIIFHGLKEIDLEILANFDKPDNVKIYWRQWNTDTNNFINEAKLYKYGISTSRRLIPLDSKNAFKRPFVKLYNYLIVLILRILTRSSYHLINNALQKIDFAGNFYSYEHEELKKYYPKYHAKYFYLNYVKELDNLPKFNGNVDLKTLKLVIGQSGYAASNHIEIIDLLNSNNLNKPIKAFLPLSYGDPNYIENIIAYCKKKSDSVFCPITEFMKYDEYYEMLNEFQVFIYNNTFPYAIFNIHSAIRMGKKVYLRNENLHKRYLEDNGIIIFSVQDLIKNPNDIFIPITRKQAENNFLKINKLFNDVNLVNGLKKIIT